MEWLVGWTTFCGLRVAVSPGVYVPRPQTETLATHACRRLPPRGVALELGSGAGAVSMVLAAARPGATVVATEIDPAAAACASSNGVDTLVGDLFGPVPPSLQGAVDVVVANLPYVPTAAIALLPRDVRDHEPLLALDGGTDGLDLLRRAVAAAPEWLRDGGWILFELGGDQEAGAREILTAAGFGQISVFADGEGDIRAVEARVRSA